MNLNDFRARLFAVLLGAALVPFVAFVPNRWFGNDALRLFLFDIATYALAGFVVGFIWSNIGWRIGLYLIAIRLPLLLLDLFFGLDQPFKLAATGLSLLGYLFTFVSACIAAALGSFVARGGSDKSQGVRMQ